VIYDLIKEDEEFKIKLPAIFKRDLELVKKDMSNKPLLWMVMNHDKFSNELKEFRVEILELFMSRNPEQYLSDGKRFQFIDYREEDTFFSQFYEKFLLKSMY